MGLKATKRDAKKLAKRLQDNYDSEEDAMLDLLTKAWQMYEETAKFNVVGQLYYEDGYIDHDDAKASKLSLGAFKNKGDIDKAVRSLTYSSGQHTQYRVWVLPIVGNEKSVMQFHKERAEYRQQFGRDQTPAERLVESWGDIPGYTIEACPTCGHVSDELTHEESNESE